MGLINEFKEFAMRGNVVDMAIGIIIGAAFTTIVNSMVEDVLMPPLGLVTGEIDFSDQFINLTGEDYPSLSAARSAGAPVIAYGSFLNAVLSFVFVAFAVFLLVKGMNRLRRQQERAPEQTPVPPRSETLLEEIRDLLKERR